MTMTRQDFIDAVREAGALYDFQELRCAERDSAVIIDTGPDDAAAVFLFSEDGSKLVGVSVEESLGPDGPL